MQQLPLKSRVLNFFRVVTGQLYRMEDMVKGAAILVYHSVIMKQRHPELERFCTPVEVFRQHINYLRKNAIVISVHELLDALKSNLPIDPRWVVITLDDALKNQVTLAAEILEEFNFPWALSVPTALIESGRSIWTYELGFLIMNWREAVLPHPNGNDILDLEVSIKSRENVANVIKNYMIQRFRMEERSTYINYLLDIFGKDRFFEMFKSYGIFEHANWSQLRALERSGVELIVHGANHQPLNGQMNEKEMLKEISASKDCMARHLAQQPKGFALPGGVLVPAAINLIKKSGYNYCMTSNTQRVNSNTDYFHLPRIDAEYPLRILRQHMLNTI